MADEQARPLTAEEIAAVAAEVRGTLSGTAGAPFMVQVQSIDQVHEGKVFLVEADVMTRLLATLDAWRPVLEAWVWFLHAELAEGTWNACPNCNAPYASGDVADVAHHPDCLEVRTRRLLGQEP